MPTLRSQKGSLLLMVLWMVVLFTIFALSVGYTARQRLHVLKQFKDRETAHRLATAGVHQAIQLIHEEKPKEKQAFDSLGDVWSINEEKFKNISLEGGTYAVVKKWPLFDEESTVDVDDLTYLFGAVDEESKLNIARQKKPAFIRRLLRFAADLEDGEASAIADSIIDWQDEDNHLYPAGAEDRYYKTLDIPYEAKDARIEVLEELLVVKGMTPEIFASIEPFITVHGTGKVNVNTASETVLRALAMKKKTAKKIISYRDGFDGKAGTKDDKPFSDVSTFLTDLDNAFPLKEKEKRRLETLVSNGHLDVSSSHFYIQSIGRPEHGKRSMMIQCVVDKGGTVKSWSEMPV